MKNRFFFVSRYFSGTDDEKTKKYNYWHGVLADYFEGVSDMDRKAEELPYHLEKLMDNNTYRHISLV